MLGHHRVTTRMSLSELSKLRERGFLDTFRYLYSRQACPMARCIKMPFFAPFSLLPVFFLLRQKGSYVYANQQRRKYPMQHCCASPPLEAKEKSIIQQLLFPSPPSAEGERKGFFGVWRQGQWMYGGTKEKNSWVGCICTQYPYAAARIEWRKWVYLPSPPPPSLHAPLHTTPQYAHTQKGTHTVLLLQSHMWPALLLGIEFT